MVLPGSTVVAVADGDVRRGVDLALALVVLPMAPAAEILGRVVMNDGTPLPEDLQVAANIVGRDGAQIDPLPRDRVYVEDEARFTCAA